MAKPPNGNWRLKMTGPDHHGSTPHANTMPTNATHRASKPAPAKTRHSSHGTSVTTGTTNDHDADD